MEEIYEYLGYILIAILLYLIVKHIYELTSKSKEGFMGIFKGDSKKGKQPSENETITQLEENIKHIQKPEFVMVDQQIKTYSKHIPKYGGTLYYIRIYFECFLNFWSTMKNSGF